MGKEAVSMTRQIHVGGIPIGGGAPVTIQSMTNTRTDDVESTLSQIRSLAAAGCQIVRVAVPDGAAAGRWPRSRRPVRSQWWWISTSTISWPWRPSRPGADKVRINPGNIGGEDRVKAVADACRLPGHPNPHRCQWRLSGEGTAGQIRRRLSGGHGGVSLRPHPSAEQIRF